MRWTGANCAETLVAKLTTEQVAVLVDLFLSFLILVEHEFIPLEEVFLPLNFDCLPYVPRNVLSIRSSKS